MSVWFFRMSAMAGWVLMNCALSFNVRLLNPSSKSAQGGGGGGRGDGLQMRRARRRRFGVGGLDAARSRVGWVRLTPKHPCRERVAVDGGDSLLAQSMFKLIT